MPCSAQNVETAPRGASSGHCEIASRTRGSMGSLTAIARDSRQNCHPQTPPNCHRCPDAEPSPMSWEMTQDDYDALVAAHSRDGAHERAEAYDRACAPGRAAAERLAEVGPGPELLIEIQRVQAMVLDRGAQ